MGERGGDEREQTDQTGSAQLTTNTDAPKIDADAARRACADPKLREIRHALARFTAETFMRAGELLYVGGHILGPDRVEGRSPFGHGSD